MRPLGSASAAKLETGRIEARQQRRPSFEPSDGGAYEYKMVDRYHVHRAGPEERLKSREPPFRRAAIQDDRTWKEERSHTRRLLVDIFELWVQSAASQYIGSSGDCE